MTKELVHLSKFAMIIKIIRAVKRLFTDDLYVTVYPGDFVAVSRDLYKRFDITRRASNACQIFTFWVPDIREFSFCFRDDSEQLRKHPELDAFSLEVDLKANLIGFKVRQGMAASILNSYGLPYDKAARLKVKADNWGGFDCYTILPPAAH